MAKKLNTLLRCGQLPREDDGAIEFWRPKDDLRNEFEYSQYWSDDVWKSKMAGGGGNKKRFQYCTNPSRQEILYLRALQGDSGRNPIDLSLQDNLLIPNNFFEYTYHVGCAVNLRSITNSGLNLMDPSLQDNVVIQSGFFHHISHIGCAFNPHSIISSGLILGGQNSSKRQTVFFLPVNPMNNRHKDPDEIDLNVPRRGQYLHNAWKRHKGVVYWVDNNLAIA